MNSYLLKKYLRQLVMSSMVMALVTIVYLVNLSQNKKVALYLENQKTLKTIQSKIGSRVSFHEYQAIKNLESKTN